MKLKFCVACGSKDDLQHHDLVTRAEGGSNDDANLITLCSDCHFKLHERPKALLDVILVQAPIRRRQVDLDYLFDAHFDSSATMFSDNPNVENLTTSDGFLIID